MESFNQISFQITQVTTELFLLNILVRLLYRVLDISVHIWHFLLTLYINLCLFSIRYLKFFIGFSFHSFCFSFSFHPSKLNLELNDSQIILMFIRSFQIVCEFKVEHFRWKVLRFLSYNYLFYNTIFWSWF